MSVQMEKSFIKKISLTEVYSKSETPVFLFVWRSREAGRARRKSKGEIALLWAVSSLRHTGFCTWEGFFFVFECISAKRDLYPPRTRDPRKWRTIPEPV